MASHRSRRGRPKESGLTTRQQEIVALAAEGLTAEQAAQRLGLQSSGIYNHTKRIREKGHAIEWAKASDAAPAVAAATNGLVPPHLTAAHDARNTLLNDAEQYVERLKEALSDRRQRLDENTTEQERLTTEREELQREVDELAATVTTAEETLANLADLPEMALTK